MVTNACAHPDVLENKQAVQWLGVEHFLARNSVPLLAQHNHADRHALPLLHFRRPLVLIYCAAHNAINMLYKNTVN